MFAKVSKIRAKQVSHLAEFHWFLPIMFIISTFSIFLNFWLHWVFVAALRLSPVELKWRGGGATVCCGIWASHCSGFSCEAQALGTWASVVVAPRLYGRGSVVVDVGLAAPGHVESPQTRDQTHVPYLGRQILIHCTNREVPHFLTPSLDHQ